MSVPIRVKVFYSGLNIFIASLVFASPVWSQLSASDAKARATQLYNESVPLIKNGDIDRAESKMAEANKLDPDNALILNNYGMVLLKLGRLDEAKKRLDRALQVRPQFDLALLNLAFVYEGLGDLQSAKKCLLQFVDVTQDRDHAEKMKEHIAMIDKTLASGAQQTPISASDYFTSEQKMYRWPKQRMPIKVYVAPADDVEGYKPSFGKDLQNGMDDWSKTLDGLVSFEKCDKPEGADIEIHWAHDFKNALTKAEGGDCKFSMNGEGMNHANITVLTIDPSATDKLNDAIVSWVSLHELGHALGFTGHSNNPGDVMYFSCPLKAAMPKLSSRDAQTFRRLYTEKLPDTWLSLNEEAVKLMRANKCEEAVEKLNAALKLNPGNETLTSNLLLVENTIATNMLNAEKFQEAEPHIQRSLDLCPQSNTQTHDSLVEKYAVLLEKTGRKDEIEKMRKRYGDSGSK